MIDKKVYFGGNFEFQYKDYTKEKLAEDYRSKVLGSVDKLMRKPEDGSGLVRLSDKASYIGPFYFYEEGMTGVDITRTEWFMVEKATDLVLLVDNKNIPGTITELIHALMSDKPKFIYVFYVREEPDKGEPDKEICNSNWYPLTICKWNWHQIVNLFECESREDAENKILEFVKREYL